MTERQEDILKTIIKEYSKSARPVGSGWISKQGDFGIKPAMIRQEMALLEQEGYLVQPHTSAGRVPTDRAYRWFIGEEVLEGERDKHETLSRTEQKKIADALASSQDNASLLHALSRVAAEISHGISVTGLADRRLFFTTGLSELAHEPEIEDSEYVRGLMQLMDTLDEQMADVWDVLFSDDIQILVGQENPFQHLDNISLVTREYQIHLPENRTGHEQAFISIIGPRRMNYKKNVALVEHICKMLNNN